jgi:hypothetical protein
MSLCKYSNIFGAPNTGIHKYRIFNVAIIDVIVTLIVSYYIYKYNNKKIKLINITIMMFILGIILHRIFCVRTTIDKLLFN